MTSFDACASRFTGKERDAESGLDNFEARYFGSRMGRFMSPDPEQIHGFDHMGDPQPWNGYGYVHNNPLNATDPDGLDCIYSNGDGTGTVQRGDCTNAGGNDDNGVFVNGTIDVNSFKYNADNNSSSFNYTTDSGGIGKGGWPILNFASFAKFRVGMLEAAVELEEKGGVRAVCRPSFAQKTREGWGSRLSLALAKGWATRPTALGGGSNCR